MVDGARPSTEATWSGGPRQSPLSATASRPGCRCSMTLRVALASHRSANHATHTRTGWCTGFCTGRPHSAASIASRRAGNAGECVHHSLHHSAIRTSRVGGGYHPLFRAAATCCRCTSAAREESNNRIIQTVHSSRLAPQSFLVPRQTLRAHLPHGRALPHVAFRVECAEPLRRVRHGAAAHRRNRTRYRP